MILVAKKAEMLYNIKIVIDKTDDYILIFF